MARSAAAASTFSDNETGRPMARSSAMKAARIISIAAWPLARRAELGCGLLDVGLMLQQDVQRVDDEFVADLLGTEQVQRLSPVDGLRYRGLLLQLELPQGAHHAGDLAGEGSADARHAAEHDLLLSLHRRVIDVQVQAPSLERLGQLTGVVRGEEDQRRLSAGNRA